MLIASHFEMIHDNVALVAEFEQITKSWISNDQQLEAAEKQAHTKRADKALVVSLMKTLIAARKTDYPLLEDRDQAQGFLREIFIKKFYEDPQHVQIKQNGVGRTHPENQGKPKEQWLHPTKDEVNAYGALRTKIVNRFSSYMDEIYGKKKRQREEMKQDEFVAKAMKLLQENVRQHRWEAYVNALAAKVGDEVGANEEDGGEEA